MTTEHPPARSARPEVEPRDTPDALRPEDPAGESRQEPRREPERAADPEAEPDAGGDRTGEQPPHPQPSGGSAR